MRFFTGVKKWELHHRIAAFLAVMILTIVIIRFAVLFVDPSPVFLHIEIHHFDYGLLLLLITTLLLLFGNPHLPIYIFMAGISFGMIIDDLWFIRSNVNDLKIKIEGIQIYNATLLSAIILSIIVILSIFLIDYFKKRKHNRN